MPSCKVETSSSLIDVLDRVLDKGIVIDARIAVLVLGVRLVEIETQVVVASLPLYASLGRPLVPEPLAGRVGRGVAEKPMPGTGSAEAAENSPPAPRSLPRQRRRRARRRKMVMRRFRCEKGCGFHLAAPAAPHTAVVRCPYGLGVVCPVTPV
jgi:hypothetical protein